MPKHYVFYQSIFLLNNHSNFVSNLFGSVDILDVTAGEGAEGGGGLTTVKILYETKFAIRQSGFCHFPTRFRRMLFDGRRI